MADEEKEKAEKLAAAKKRFEQLKKEQQKKAKKGGKKKGEKAADSKTEVESKDEDNQDEAIDDTADGEPAADDATTAPTDDNTPAQSESQQSKQRSESFKQSWTARIEELEQENKTLRAQADERTVSLSKAEADLEKLRESSSDLAELRAKAKDNQRLADELAAVQRQLTQAQQAARPSNRRTSSAIPPDLSTQLDAKNSTIESLELELSNLRNQLTTLQSTLSTLESTNTTLQTRAETAESQSTDLQTELNTLKVSLSFPSDSSSTSTTTPDPTAQIAVLESSLRTAQSDLDRASTRATSLESKIEALTKLHSAATTASAAKDKELETLRRSAARRERGSHVRDASEFELGDDEGEDGSAGKSEGKESLEARIRALEAENFELKRGVWRERRTELQPGMQEDGEEGGLYQDVDLTPGPYSGGGGVFGGGSARNGGVQRQHSTFQDVITSGISAFTGRPREVPVVAGRERKGSLGLLSDDGFDEDAYRLAQEEEAKRRIERVKDIKRGLNSWKGWRVDLADVRRSGMVGGRQVGPVFDV